MRRARGVRKGRIDVRVNDVAGPAQGPGGQMTRAHRDMVEVNLTAPVERTDRMRNVMGRKAPS